MGIVLNFSLLEAAFFFYSFCLVYIKYETVDSMDNYKSLNINIGTVIKTSEMLKFVSDHLKTKKMCKHLVKKLPYLLRYVPDQCKTKQTCDKTILENDGTLKSVPD